jgi:hypothetical protein
MSYSSLFVDVLAGGCSRRHQYLDAGIVVWPESLTFLVIKGEA